MNEIAVVEQLPVITEKIKKVGEELEKRLENLNLDNLVCNEETRKSCTELRTALKKEQTEFETQRKNIKNQIMQPYNEFNKIYEEQIKNKYEQADLTLKNKIDEVEQGIKNNTKTKMIEFFEEYRTFKLINKDWLKFDELSIKLGINQLTPKGDLVKKVKDEIKERIDKVSEEIKTINSMENNIEIFSEYLKHKNLSLAIKDVNDRHLILDTLKETEESTKGLVEKEEQVIEQVEEILHAPVEEKSEIQMTVDDFEEPQSINNEFEKEEIFETTFTVKGTLKQLQEVKHFLEQGGYNYE